MSSPRKGSPRRARVRRQALWAGLALGWLLPSVGCQVEYAGMTLPSGKYMMDDVQYFPPGPEFPWSNTQAATQRARMASQGIPLPGSGVLPGAPGAAPAAATPLPPGAIDPTQNLQGRPTNVNSMPAPPAPPVVAPGVEAVPAAPGAAGAVVPVVPVAPGAGAAVPAEPAVPVVP